MLDILIYIVYNINVLGVYSLFCTLHHLKNTYYSLPTPYMKVYQKLLAAASVVVLLTVVAAISTASTIMFYSVAYI